MIALLLALMTQDLPRPLPPKEALATFKVPDGFEITLVAAEPDVLDPAALAFDEKGRLWVVEMADYPLGPPAGRIRVLEDVDGDGRIDRSTLFARGLATPTSVLPFRDGVLVTAAPDILFLKDTDGDGRADVREVVFTGFKEGNQQHRVNGLVFTLDNRISGANGDSGGTIVRHGAPPVPINGRDFRFRPDFAGFEAVAGHGQYANTFDAWGRRYINDNSNHIRHPVLPLHYLARNPWLAVPAVEEAVSDHPATVHPTSPILARPNDPHAAGRFTSACSVTAYVGGAFGPAYADSAFVCEPVHNLVHRDVLVPKGASMSARRGETDTEFLTSTDNWFRPVHLAVGPDGALYVADMYRAVIEHPQWIPLEMQKRLDLRAGEDKGRIWRIAPKGLPRALAPIGDPVAELDHPNGWRRTTAQRLLVERQDRSAVDRLRGLASSGSPLGRLHALWTLEGLSALDAGPVKAALSAPEPGLREHAVRLAERFLDVLGPDILRLASDPDPRVRFQVALSAGELGAVEPIAAILARDAADKWTRLAALSSLKGRSAALLSMLPADFLEKPAPGATDLVRQLAETVAASREDAQAVDWLRAVADGPPVPWRLSALAGFVAARRGGPSLDALLVRAGVDAQVRAWVSTLLDTALDEAAQASPRASAIGLLASIPVEGLAAKLDGLLTPRTPHEVQTAAVRALARLGGEEKLLEGWTRHTTAVRREVLSVCFARPALVGRILEKLEKGEVRPVELEQHHREALLKHASDDVRSRAKAVLERRDGELEETIAEMHAKVLKLPSDPVRGEKVYMTSCATCHRLNGQGFQVGPGLESVAGRDKLALLTDILDPNRAVAPQFQVYVVKTASGELVSGIIAAETPSGVTLRRANAEETTVLRRDIAELKAWPASLMPQGVEQSLSSQDFADLLEFLQRGKVR